MPSTITKRFIRACYRRQRGSAALEVLLLLPFILLIWLLLVDMSYNGVRRIKSQTGLHLAAFQYVDALATSNRAAAQKTAEAAVNQSAFPGEQKPATLFVSGEGGNSGGFKDDQGLLGSASSREVIRLSVARTPPYGDVLPRTPIDDRLVVASNTWTYCEMKDKDFKGVQSAALEGLDLVGNYALWLFGGCGGDTLSFSCKDRCKD